MELAGKTIGFALTGSFCTLQQAVEHLTELVDAGAIVVPIVSNAVDSTDTRFGKAADWQAHIEAITGNKILKSITDSEPIGPKGLLDIIIVCPCTGNTIAKIANGITDTPVTMAVKAHLRNNRPVVIYTSTNDGLGANAKNIGMLLNAKNIFFVPFRQDDAIGKNNSLIGVDSFVLDTIKAALDNKQIQPLLQA